MIDYKKLCNQIESLAEASGDMVAIMANASAILFDAMPDINWAGFYIVKDDALIVGPFQGKVACVRIERGRGVCGTSWAEDATMLVPDVHAFPGHIACDSASNSEIVIPIHASGEVIAVLDIDSPNLNRFSKQDKLGLEEFVCVLESVIK